MVELFPFLRFLNYDIDGYERGYDKCFYHGFTLLLCMTEIPADSRSHKQVSAMLIGEI